MTVTWFDDDDFEPPRDTLVWVVTKSGKVATGYKAFWWIVDGYRVRDSEDSPTHWALIVYPPAP